VRVTGVEGQVLYGARDERPTVAVRAGQAFGPGTFSAGTNGILYLSAFDGSELRLSETGTLHYDGDDQLCRLEGPGGNLRSNFHLLQGKAQITIRFPARPRHCYQVKLRKASASTAQGQCVMCMHGASTFLFVARGRLMVTTEPGPDPLVLDREPTYGAVPVMGGGLASSPADRPQILVGDGTVGVIGIDGHLHSEALSSLSAGTQTCLLSGLHLHVVEGGGKSTGPDSENPPISPPSHLIVSPTE
jgi:hypothetical protein